jgi:CSLREA domain-containing protein
VVPRERGRSGNRAVYRFATVDALFDAGFAASALIRLDDGAVAARTAAGGVFLCIGSAVGASSDWGQPNSVVAGDGATWLLATGAVPPTADARILRWGGSGGPAFADASGVRLTVTPGGVVRARTAAGNLSERAGSQSGLGTAWVAIPESLVVTTLADEDNGAADPSLGAGVSLREAINYAQAKLGADTVTFAANVTGTITLNGSELFVGSSGGPVTILGPGAGKLAVSGDLKSRVFNLDRFSVSTISGLSVINGSDIITGPYGAYGYSGAGVYVGEYAKLTLASCVVSGNSADSDGGGLYIDYGAEVLISDCLISGNTATDGGGIYNDGGTLTIVGSSITGNTASDDGGGIDSWGPAIIAGSNISGNTADDEGGGGRFSDSLTMTNTTISGNTTAGNGGGLNLNDSEPATLINCTVAGNTAAGEGGGIYVYFYSGTYGTYGAKVTATNTIISGNSAPTSPDVHNALLPASSNNLIGLSAAAAGLAPLANNGGPTQTIALLPGSPAINAGKAMPDMTRDQRGAARVGSIDIGAFEYTPATSLVVTTATDENDGVSDPAVGAGTSLREAITAAQQAISASGFGYNGAGWTRAGGANNGLPLVIGGPTPSQDAVTLTTAEQGMATALWYNQKVNVNSFSVSFRYTQDRGASGADGFTLAFQNAGLNVVGGGGGGVGYGGLGASAAIAFNIYGGYTVGVTAFTNGAVSDSYTPLGNGVSLTNGQPLDVTITGVGPAVTVTLTQGTNSFTLNYPTLNIAGQVGGPASYVGFTAATGGVKATQVISQFSLSSAATPATVTFAPALGGQTISLTEGWTEPAGPTAFDISSDVTVQGPTTAPGITLAVSGAAPRRHFRVAPSGALTLSHLTLTGGKATDGDGGAVENFGALTVRNCVLTGNSANQGGAIQSVGTLTIEDSTLSGNNSSFNGGALRLFGTTTLRGSTFAGNTAINQGGALINFGPQLVVSNCTFVDNDKDAVLIWDGAAEITNTTIAYNRNGGLTLVSASPSTVRNTIVAGNAGGDVLIFGAPLAPASGNNLLNLSAAAAGLGTLANNGGPTQTVALLPGSPAIDAGNSTITTDQRGLPRVGAPDIGAFELQLMPPVTVSSVAVGDGSSQRSTVRQLVVTFSSPVTFTGAPAAAFSLTRQSDSAPVTLAVAMNPANTVATITFTGGAVNGTSLADGRYTLNVLADQFAVGGLDGDGNGSPGDNYTLVGTPANGLFRLFGDADGNGQTGISDFLAFRLAFLSGNAAFDFDGNGTVDAGDFLQFRLRFLASV